MNKITFQQADLEFKLDVDNPNVFNIVSKALNYNLIVNGSNWAKGKTSNKIMIKEKNNNMIAIPISLNLFEMGRTAYSMLTGNKKINYNFTGNLDLESSITKIGSVNIPINRSGQLNILR